MSPCPYKADKATSGDEGEEGRTDAGFVNGAVPNIIIDEPRLSAIIKRNKGRGALIPSSCGLQP